jgi:hypothetical protein
MLIRTSSFVGEVYEGKMRYVKDILESKIWGILPTIARLMYGAGCLSEKHLIFLLMYKLRRPFRRRYKLMISD